MISLAEFITEKREKAGMSASGFAKRAGVDLYIVEDIESGKELFLSVTVRQKLARALKLQPAEIKHYEKNVNEIIISQEQILDLKELILNGEEDLYCPICGNKLVVSLLKRYDIEDNLVFDPKAHCSKCVFQVK